MAADDDFTERLGSDDLQFGALVTTCTPLVIEAYGDVGFDFAFVDLEHGGPSPADSERLADLVRAGETAGIDLLVRLPSGRPPLVQKVLDAGVRNVLIPRVETADEVRTAAAATRFTYDGEPGDRGIGNARSTRWGSRLDADYPDRADGSVSLGIMVETERAVANLPAILETPGVGFALLGHHDLAISLGANTPTADATQERVAEFEQMCRDRGVPFGRYTGTDEVAVSEALEAGYGFVLLGDETSAVRDTYGAFLSNR